MDNGTYVTMYNKKQNTLHKELYKELYKEWRIK